MSRPTIKEDPEWRIEEGCGYERCGGPPADFLVGKDLKIRIGSQSSEKPPLFLIVAAFLLNHGTRVEINPSLTHVELSNKQIRQAKGYHCSARIFDTNYQVHIPPIHSTTVLTAEGNKDCIYFIFEPPPPKADEAFKLIIGGVTVDGRSVQIPEIIFKPMMTRF